MPTLRAQSASFDNRGFRRTFAQGIFNPNVPLTLAWKIRVNDDRATFGTYPALVPSAAFTGTNYWVCFHEGVSPARWAVGHEGADAFATDTVTIGKLYSQGFRRFPETDGSWTHEFYYDLPDLTKVVTKNSGVGFGTITLASDHEFSWGYVGYATNEGSDANWMAPLTYLAKLPLPILQRQSRYNYPLPELEHFLWQAQPELTALDLKDRYRNRHFEAVGAVVTEPGLANFFPHPLSTYSIKQMVQATAAGSAADASSDGAGTATAEGSAGATSAAASDGVATATAVGSAAAAVVASSDATSTADAVGTSAASALATSDGVGLASAEGVSAASSIISADGAATAIAEGISQATAVIASDGVGLAVAEGQALSAGASDATSDGVGFAAAEGTSTATADATADALGTALAVGVDASAVAPTPDVTAPSRVPEGSGGAWAHPSGKQRKLRRQIADEDKEIIALIKQIAPTVMSYLRTP